MKNSLVAPSAAALGLHAATRIAAAQDAPAAPAAAPANMPQGKIADMMVSRLLLGGNLLTHYTHSRDLKYVYNLTANYNTEEKIIETMARAEEQGINTLVVHTVPRVQQIIKRYRQSLGGKIQWIICPTAPVEDGFEAYRTQVRECVDDGVDAIYLWGVHGDALIGKDRADLIAGAVEVAREEGVPSGVGAHDLRVIAACEEKGIPADFYIKTFHHHNYPSGPKPEEINGPHNEFPGYWCSNPEETIALMAKVTKPWIAFKVMAAGTIPPEDAFRYVFTNGADHVLAGMFDFEIVQDANIAREVLASVERTRPWCS